MRMLHAMGAKADEYHQRLTRNSLLRLAVRDKSRARVYWFAMNETLFLGRGARSRFNRRCFSSSVRLVFAPYAPRQATLRDRKRVSHHHRWWRDTDGGYTIRLNSPFFETVMPSGPVSSLNLAPIRAALPRIR